MIFPKKNIIAIVGHVALAMPLIISGHVYPRPMIRSIGKTRTIKRNADMLMRISLFDGGL